MAAENHSDAFPVLPADPVERRALLVGQPGIGKSTLAQGLADSLEGLVRGILWDRVGDRGPRLKVAELHGERIRRFLVQGGCPGCV